MQMTLCICFIETQGHVTTGYIWCLHTHTHTHTHTNAHPHTQTEADTLFSAGKDSFAVQSKWPHNSTWSLARRKAPSLPCGAHTHANIQEYSLCG